MSPRGFNEDDLIEQPAIRLFESLGWEAANAYDETFVPAGGWPFGRAGKNEVVLPWRLRESLERLNPDLPSAAINLVIEELTRDRSALSAVAANQETYDLLKNGVRIKVSVEGNEEPMLARVIDWQNVANNDFLLASQFWVSGEVYTRRADLVGFVNGLPLVFVELKTGHRRIEDAYEGNLRDYRNTVPQLFWYNATIILSNGGQSRIGTITSEWEHFAEWKRLDDEGEEGIVSLETMIRGTCAPERLLDLAENFTLYTPIPGGTAKVIGKNHQYLGVNKAFDRLASLGPNDGRLGVFWHTQGSGKSFSMMFFAQKVLRRLPGHHTFVILTDRLELDDQIYKTFAGAGAVTESEDQVRADSGDHLRQLLTEDHRYVFTTIQKFHTRDGATYPVISERDDIIVIADEAHRSQYDAFATNMRNALPNATFIAFTGTPLLVGEEKTREVFGEYVSVYDFKQSIDDGATVPLYYENRIPELQITNENLNADMEALLESAELDEEQERKLEREFAREYHLITREDRLDAIAKDIVQHFVSRGFKGKGMVVSIDKATAVSMYDRVRRHWQTHIAELEQRLADTRDAFLRDELMDSIKYMRETDMAVVVSQSQNEAEDLAKRGLDILPHRKRMLNEDLATKFKDPDDPFRLVFVCAMWMTGFDVPSCSTIYLDKPMRNHTLMQTIARANRVFPAKENGLIVDYAGVFRDLQRALAVYGPGGITTLTEGDTPVKDKDALVTELQIAIEDTRAFLAERGVEVAPIVEAEGFERLKLIDDAVNAVLVNDESKSGYLALAALVDRLFRAVQPDPAINAFRPMRTVFWVVAAKIRSLTPQADISEVMRKIAELLDLSIESVGYEYATEDERSRIGEPKSEYDPQRVIDISNIDFDALRAAFEKGHRNTEVEKLKGQVAAKLATMVQLNRQRIDYLERFQALIEEYNAGSANIESFFEQLLLFTQELNDEERRHIAEGLSEEELAIFDLLTKPEPKLTKAEEAEVKKVARDLLTTLKAEKLVLDWKKKPDARAGVWVAIEVYLDRLPEAPYPTEVYTGKCNSVYQHVYDAYQDAGHSIYGAVN